MAPEVLYTLLAGTTMRGCWLGLRGGIVLGSAGGAAGQCRILPIAIACTFYLVATHYSLLHVGRLPSKHMKPSNIDVASPIF